MSSLEEFLDGIRLPRKHAKVLTELGYEDVDEYKNYDEDYVQAMRSNLQDKSVPAGHIDKLCRAIKAARDAANTQTQEQGPQVIIAQVGNQATATSTTVEATDL